VQNSLIVSFVTEEAAVFGGVFLRQGILFPGSMACSAVSLSYFFAPNRMKLTMILVYWESWSSLFRGSEEKSKDSDTADDESHVYAKSLFPFHTFKLSFTTFNIINHFEVFTIVIGLLSEVGVCVAARSDSLFGLSC
jgi:hypothetical protein